ncbi:Chemosensory protein 12 [Operophtera brumata]|uniref:Chemosensory protein 12 n=1 Tax=Operophtera brumata TaxID=104452 RepID=A0A0L7LKP2_OPEBR|nr:Chemosensory protein 12 [Operophtera brumata]
MNAAILALVAVALPLVSCYDEKYDKIDVDKIIADADLFTACSSRVNAFKLLPEVISTSCEKCSPIQKEHVRKTVKALSEKRPDDFVKFREKYDPDGKYEKSFSAFVLGGE